MTRWSPTAYDGDGFTNMRALRKLDRSAESSALTVTFGTSMKILDLFMKRTVPFYSLGKLEKTTISGSIMSNLISHFSVFSPTRLQYIGVCNFHKPWPDQDSTTHGPARRRRRCRTPHRPETAVRTAVHLPEQPPPAKSPGATRHPAAPSPGAPSPRSPSAGCVPHCARRRRGTRPSPPLSTTRACGGRLTVRRAAVQTRRGRGHPARRTESAARPT